MTSSHHTFSLNRFLRLCRAEAQANWKSLGLYTGITGLICLLIAYESFTSELGATSYFLLGLLFVILFFFLLGLSGYLACASVKRLKKRDSACQAMMLPASRVEKFSVILFFYGVLFPVFLWLLVAAAAYLLYSTSEVFNALIDGSKVLLTFKFDKSFILWALTILFTQSYFFAGSMFLNKRPFAKLIFIWIAFNIFISWFVQLIFNDVDLTQMTNELVNGAFADVGYSKNFWILSSILSGTAVVFIVTMWQKFRRHVMP